MQQQRSGWAAAEAGTLRISQSCAWRPLFDGSVANGEQTKNEVLISRGRMSAGFGQEGGFEAVESGVPIKVGCPGASVEALTKAFGLDLVRKAPKEWGILVSQITYMLILSQILDAGSPTEGWNIFESFHVPNQL